jgi:hypothetical protein
MAFVLPSVGTPSKYFSVPIDVLTLSGAVNASGIGVVIFILGGLVQPFAANVSTITRVKAIVNKCFVFILFTPFEMTAFGCQVSGVRDKKEQLKPGH